MANKILTLPDSSSAPLSIRAKALVFHDPGSQSLLEHVERLARSDATVLVIGETGTGKELIARHIHNTSGRNGPFVAVNCGAFSETLIDAELFGHESGAFTGASHARAGWFESANGGTLFLDEIGDLPMSLQVKLLRVLQERQVVRLGSRRPVALDVRLIAATNIDLGRAVEAQHFRADLYYRLSVASVRLPPLGERRADILPLAEHFIGVYRSRLGLPQGVALSPAAQQALLAYSWPGNIRELENVIHYALIVCRSDIIEAGDLKLVPLTSPGFGSSQHFGQNVSPSAGQGSTDSSSAAQAVGFGGYGGVAGLASGGQRPAAPQEPGLPAPAEAAPVEAPSEASASPRERLSALFADLLAQELPNLFDEVEDALIHTAFAATGQNQVRTARVLGITRNMLRTQLKRHGLLGDGPGGNGDGAGEGPDAGDELDIAGAEGADADPDSRFTRIPPQALEANAAANRPDWAAAACVGG